MENKITRVLQTAKEIILKGWCKGSNAVDENGCSVHVDSKVACRWCASGALRLACYMVDPLASRPPGWREACETEHGQPDLVDDAREAFRKPNNLPSIVYFNDHPARTLHEVLEAFNKAIAESEKGE